MPKAPDGSHPLAPLPLNLLDQPTDGKQKEWWLERVGPGKGGQTAVAIVSRLARHHQRILPRLVVLDRRYALPFSMLHPLRLAMLRWKGNCSRLRCLSGLYRSRGLHGLVIVLEEEL
jgi:hypothetical protein